MASIIKTVLCSIWLIFAAFSTAFAGNSESNFGGVGIDGVPQQNGEIVIRQLVIGGPAHRAGIRVGDIITHIDSKATKGSDFKEIVDRRLRGKAGTKVLISLRRPGQEKPLSFTLTRKQLVIPSPKP